MAGFARAASTRAKTTRTYTSSTSPALSRAASHTRSKTPGKIANLFLSAKDDVRALPASLRLHLLRAHALLRLLATHAAALLHLHLLLRAHRPGTTTLLRRLRHSDQAVIDLIA